MRTLAVSKLIGNFTVNQLPRKYTKTDNLIRFVYLVISINLQLNLFIVFIIWSEIRVPAYYIV